MKKLTLFGLGLAVFAVFAASRFQSAEEYAGPPRLFLADDPNIQYTGRIDFSNPKKPRFSASGVYVQAKFKGPTCDVMIDDEVLWGNSHNYIEVAIDDQKPVRLQTTGKTNTFHVADGLPGDFHTITVCKDTESGIGALEFVGFKVQKLVKLPPKPEHKIEFIGDSITCGAESDLSKSACGSNPWYDRHNAYLAYGPTTARILGTQWQLTSVSGIGLMHSCCNMKQVMPDVFDKVNLRDNSGKWDFSKYQPDVVSICLGQNDGTQDPAQFQANYIKFIGQVRAAYPNAQIALISSPMADARLRDYLRTNLSAVAEQVKAKGDTKISTFIFSRSYNAGCGGHPDVAQHQIIAGELANYLKTTMKW